MVANNRNSPRSNIQLIPKSLNQESYIISLLDPSVDISISYGPAGSGKSYLAMLAAIKAFKDGQCERIVLTRPAVGVDDEKHGFLPGTLEEKMSPWVKPLFDILRDYYPLPEITKMMANETIELCPLTFMRGRTFRDCWVVADEMQGTSSNQMKMLLTRIGENSKLVITGDLEQTDRKFQTSNGLKDLIDKVERFPNSRITLTEFGQSDVQRHHLINHILNMYAED